MEINQIQEEKNQMNVVAEEAQTVVSEKPQAIPVQPFSKVEPESCSSCDAEKAGASKANSGPNYIYSLGKVSMRFPSPGIEKEFKQAVARAETAGKTEAQIVHDVLSQPENEYLVRHLCWVFSIEDIETYILMPRTFSGYSLLVDSISPVEENRPDIDLVIGLKGGIAAAEHCGGLSLPVVGFDQIYSYDQKSFIESIPMLGDKKGAGAEKQFRQAATELYGHISQMADNAGATNEHRALNYLAARYPNIYSLTADRHQADYSLMRISTIPSRLSGARKIVDVIFTFTHRKTDVPEKYFVRVDVTEKFPYIVSKLAPYYDR
jgi:hypothetical protein